MKRNSQDASAATNGEEASVAMHAEALHAENGHLSPDNLSVILAGLQTMRDGDFSVRLPGNWTGLAGKNRGHVQ